MQLSELRSVWVIVAAALVLLLLLQLQVRHLLLIWQPALLLVRLQAGVQPHSLVWRHLLLLLLLLLQSALPLQEVLLLGQGRREPVLAARVLKSRVLRHLVPRGQLLPGPELRRLWQPTCKRANVSAICAVQRARL